jgi:Fur family transcriptional regulator, zinc uptake regulator
MTQNAVNAEFPSPKHNHARCIASAIQAARDAFKRRGLSLTPLREAIFLEISASHRAIGAYEVRDRLKAKGRDVQPMSVYRSIEACIQAGVVRRFESGNAFYASTGSDPLSPRIALACQECGCIGEADGAAAFAVIRRAAASCGFALRGAVIEVTGTCRHCVKTTASVSR